MNKKILYHLLALLLLFGVATTMNAQVTIGGGTAPVNGAVLDLSPAQGDPSKPGTIGGLLLPNVSIKDMELIPEDFSHFRGKTPAERETVLSLAGTVVYNINDNIGAGKGMYIWDGYRWRLLVETDGVKVTGVSLNESSISLVEGSTLQLLETIVPANASNKGVTWHSDNPNVAIVVNGLVTGISASATRAAGETKIRVRTLDGNHEAVCNVTVTKQCIAPIVTTDPLSQDRTENEQMTLSVNATGTDLKYQWYLDSAPITGAKNSSYTVTNVKATHAGVYYCEVSSGCGAAMATSASATVTVCVLPSIDKHPEDANPLEGATLRLEVIATGTNITYQWYKGSNAITGEISSVYEKNNVSSTDKGTYYCKIKGKCGTEISSNPATVDICVPAKITTPPDALTNVNEGQTFTLTVAATGTNLKYQWYKGVTPVGTDSPTFTKNNATPADDATYYCEVKADCGATLKTTGAVVSVCTPISIKTEPLAQAINQGGKINLSVEVLGTNPSYQWYKGLTPVGTNSPTFTKDDADADDEADYKCTITGKCGTVTTTPVRVSVCVPITIKVEPQAQSLTEGGTITLSITVEGTNPTYQWYKGTTPIPGARSDIFSKSGVTTADTDTYYCEVKGKCTTTAVKSDVVQVTVGINCIAPSISTPPEGQSRTENEQMILSVVAVGTDLKYQWYKDGSPIAIAGTNSTYTVNNVKSTHAGVYHCVVSSGCTTAKATSSNAIVTVCIPASIIDNPEKQDINEGGAISLIVKAAGTGLTYQWTKDGSPISGAQSATYTKTNAQVADGGSYVCEVKGTCGTVQKTTAVTVTVCTPASISDHPAPTVNQNENTTLTLTVTAVGTGLTYQWYQGATPVGTNNRIYTKAGATAADNGTYKCVVTGKCGTATSNLSVVTLCTPVSIVTPPSAPAAVCQGGSISLSVGAVGTGLTYQWHDKDGAIAGATAASYSGVAKAGAYKVVVSGTCGAAVTSSSVTAVVNIPVSIVTPPSAPAAVCQGGNITLSVGAAGTGLTYQWHDKDGAIAGAKSASYTGVAKAGNYHVVVSGICGAAATSTPVTAVVNIPASISVPPTTPVNIDEGQILTLSVTAVGTGLTYQWYQGSTPVGTNSRTYQKTNAKASDSGDYHCIVKAVCGAQVKSAISKVTVKEDDPSTIPTGAGTFTGQTCFDVVMTNDGGNCGLLANRQTQKHDFGSNNKITYTFTASGTISKLRFVRVNAAGAEVIESLTPGNAGWATQNNLSGNFAVVANYKSTLNSLATGKDRNNALKSTIYAVYNNAANGTGSDVQIALSISVMDCICCPGYMSLGGEYTKSGYLTIANNSNWATTKAQFTATGKDVCFYKTDPTPATSNWQTAKTNCENGTNVDAEHRSMTWRLPTLAELGHIQDVHASLPTQTNSAPGTTALVTNHYWSSTETSSTHAWYWYFISSTAIQNDKTFTGRSVRCVRSF